MKKLIDDIGLAAVILIISSALLFLIIPIVIAVMMSFDARAFLGPIPPTDFSLQWYKNFFADSYYIDGLKMSLTLAIIASIVSALAGVSAAIVIDRYEFKGKKALEALFLSPLVVPGVVIGFALLLFFASLGIFEGLPRLLGGHVIITLPYTIRTTLAGLVGIRRNLTEAAMSLGATEKRAFWDITLPLAQTGIVAGIVFAFAFSMDDVAVSMFLTSPQSYTLPVAMVSMMRTKFDLTIAAGSVLLMVFTGGIILILDRIYGLDKLIGKGLVRSK